MFDKRRSDAWLDALNGLTCEQPPEVTADRLGEQRRHGVSNLSVLRVPRPVKHEHIAERLESSALPNTQGAADGRMRECSRRDVPEERRNREGRLIPSQSRVGRGMIGHPASKEPVGQQMGRYVLPVPT